MTLCRREVCSRHHINIHPLQRNAQQFTDVGFVIDDKGTGVWHGVGAIPESELILVDVKRPVKNAEDTNVSIVFKQIRYPVVTVKQDSYVATGAKIAMANFRKVS